MDWQPISENGIWERILTAESRLDIELSRLWEAIKIHPAKWAQNPYGTPGGGFWAVGIFGQHVLWFNDLEDGFNVSRYETLGIISEYTCNQDELEQALRSVLNFLRNGYALPFGSAPQAGQYERRT